MLPILPQTEAFPNEAIREFLLLLDTGAPVDDVQAVRWRFAIEDGQWTVSEAMAAARWLNLHHTGYVKIAHVHERILSDRKWLKIARMFCYMHPYAVEVVSDEADTQLTAEKVRRLYEDNPRAWRADYEAEVMSHLTDTEWVTWARANAKQFPQASA